MPRIDQSVVATAILSAAGWARVGITAPTEALRDDAANELARAIVAEIDGEALDRAHPDQLPLAL